MKRRRDSGEFAAEGSNAGCLSLSFWEDLLLVYSFFKKTNRFTWIWSSCNETFEV